MWWQYMLVFVGALLFDIVPFPFLPAFTIMVFLQITFGLAVWPVLIIGVIGSVLGRYILTLYIPSMANKLISKSKNEDVEFLGSKLKENIRKGQLFVLAYSLLPLPTTPLFLAAGISKINALYIIPAFFVGKFTSDALALLAGKYASESIDSLTDNLFTWKSIASFAFGLVLIAGIFIIDWRTLIQKKKLVLNFRFLK